MNLTDKVALVTGGAHRVGKAIAVELARAGAHVAVHYRSAGAAVTDTIAEIEALGVRAVAVQADLSTEAGVAALFAQVEAAFGGLDVLVNSAAGMEPGDVRTLTREAWQRVLDLNLTAPFFCAQGRADARPACTSYSVWPNQRARHDGIPEPRAPSRGRHPRPLRGSARRSSP